MADTKALFTQRFDAARTALNNGDEPAAAESLHWAILAARSDPTLRRELASALLKLGKLSRKFGKAGEAEAGALLTEALAISEEVFGRDHAAVAPVLHELSRLHLQQSQHARAKETLERLLVIARRNGEEHADVATALSGLAFVNRKLGDDGSAESLYRDALRIREKVLEPNHVDTLGTLEQLSETCAARGNHAEALALLQRALPSREATLGPAHERVRAARSRVAKLELQLAIEADTAAADAAKAARVVTPTPIWLKKVPETPADTPSSAPPLPVKSKELEFVPEYAPQALRPSPRARERAMTPTVAAAVAVASLLASPLQTPSASQIVIPSSGNAGPFGNGTRRDSGATRRDLVFSDVAYGAFASAEATPNDWRSPVASGRTHSSGKPRKKRTALYASAGATTFAIAIAALLMLRPRSGSARNPADTEIAAAQPATSAAAAAAVVTSAPTRTTPAATASAAATRADSLRAPSPTSRSTTAAVTPDQPAKDGAPLELHAPRVQVHVGSIAMPGMPAALSADSILHSAIERQHASDSERTGTTKEVSEAASANSETARTAPKIIGHVPQPSFPEALLRSGPREGQVIVRFMVNELGRVDVGTMIVEKSDNDAFTNAVRDVLPEFRFEPAHLRTSDWKPVAAWVSMPFRFTTKK